MRGANANSKLKILLRAPNWLGDIILVMPAVNALREALPDAKISVLVKESMADFWRMTCVDNVISFSEKSSGIVGRRKLAGKLKKEKFDSVLIFPNSFDSAFVPWLAGIPERVGWPSDGRGFLLNNKISKPDHLKDKRQFLSYVYLVEKWLGKEVDAKTELSLKIPEEDRGAIKNELANFSAPIIGLNPGATYGSAKCWPAEYYAELSLKFHKEKNANIIIVGGPGDTKTCEDIFNCIEKEYPGAKSWCKNLSGKTSICRLAAWLEQCSFLITNDTGGMHVSAAVGTPVAAIFGPTDWSSTAPLGPNHKLIKTDADCAPCLKRECPTDHHCMTSIKPEKVWKEIKDML